MKTVMANKKNVKMKWHLLDASDKVLGRLAAQAAIFLIGKHKVDYTPHVDMGDGVVIINAEKVKITGKKMEQKFYKRFSGYPGGLKEEPLKHLIARRPTDVLRHAIDGMIPKNRLGRRMIKRLKIYVGSKNPHTAQTITVKAKKEKAKDTKKESK